jgi:glyoxylate reductase
MSYAASALFTAQNQLIQLGTFPLSDTSKQVLEQHQLHPAVFETVDALLTAYPAPQANITALMCMVCHKIDRQVLDRFPNLKLIASYGAGVDHIDLPLAKEREILVSNTPSVLHETTADLTWALMLAACRRIVESDAFMHQGQFRGWLADLHLGVDIHGKTLGIVGMGEIGQAVARRASGFNMRVVYTQRTQLPANVEASLQATYLSFESLVQQSDIISIHSPLTPETRHLFNRDTLLKMKPLSVLINTARGPIIDEAALAEVLKNGPLFAAGLDVFEREPEIHPELLQCKNAILTAHIGSATLQTRQALGDCTINNLMAWRAGKTPQNLVTF